MPAPQPTQVEEGYWARIYINFERVTSPRRTETAVRRAPHTARFEAVYGLTSITREIFAESGTGLIKFYAGSALGGFTCAVECRRREWGEGWGLKKGRPVKERLPSRAGYGRARIV